MFLSCVHQITLESAASLYYVSDFFQMSGPGNLIERVSKFLHGKVRDHICRCIHSYTCGSSFLLPCDMFFCAA